MESLCSVHCARFFAAFSASFITIQNDENLLNFYKFPINIQGMRAGIPNTIHMHSQKLKNEQKIIRFQIEDQQQFLLPKAAANWNMFAI